MTEGVVSKSHAGPGRPAPTREPGAYGSDNSRMSARATDPSAVKARIRRTRALLGRGVRAINSLALSRKYRTFTMAPPSTVWRNLLLADSRRHVAGCVVECGVWRGGMSAAMAELLGDGREYFLFDSFEGLPAVTSEDGDVAKAWQQNVTSPTYYDNCSAHIEYAEQAMRLTGVSKYRIVQGWFNETVVEFVPPTPIAILRLDADWYDSTLVVLQSLFKYLARDGVVIVDDYYTWDGCSRAVHDFLSRHQLTARLGQEHGICVIVPRE